MSNLIGNIKRLAGKVGGPNQEMMSTSMQNIFSMPCAFTENYVCTWIKVSAK